MLHNPPSLYDPTRHGYSQLAIVPAGVGLIFMAGQFGVDRDGNLAADFCAQVRQIFDNLDAGLTDSGSSLALTVRLTVLIVDLDAHRLASFEAEIKKRFAVQPVVTLIPVSRLAAPDPLIEIDAIAVHTNGETL